MKTAGGILLGFVACCLVVLVGGVLYAKHAVGDRTLPLHDTTVVIPNGASGRDVARLLVSNGVISSIFWFDALARYEGKQSAMKAGEFDFGAHSSMEDVLREVTGNGKQIAVWVTVPEGFMAREIAQALDDKEVGSYDQFASYFAHTPLDVFGTKTPSLEGYLFPDTYLIPADATPPAVAKIMTDHFFAELPPGAAKKAKAHGLTVPEVVTLASLVEREAKSDDERPLMAGVYYNRLKLGMPLEVDATIEYTFEHHKDVITLADLARDSPYNTYKHTGLPPTPIANPGRPSLWAAFDPKPSPFLYYVYMGNGHHAFARTLAEHNANVARYLR